MDKLAGSGDAFLPTFAFRASLSITQNLLLVYSLILGIISFTFWWASDRLGYLKPHRDYRKAHQFTAALFSNSYYFLRYFPAIFMATWAFNFLNENLTIVQTSIAVVFALIIYSLMTVYSKNM